MLKSVTIKDGADSFTVSIHQSIPGSPVVLFAVGAGGVPERHATLLNTCIDGGYTVIAPHFERLVSRFPEAGDLTVRARRLSLAIDSFSQPDSEIVGVGHSIGAATLVAMAGAQM